jgi:hypothetical protein
MRGTASHQVLEANIESPRRLDYPPGVQQVEPGHMTAGDEIGHITRRQPQPSTVKPHGTPVASYALASYTAPPAPSRPEA